MSTVFPFTELEELVAAWENDNADLHIAANQHFEGEVSVEGARAKLASGATALAQLKHHAQRIENDMRAHQKVIDIHAQRRSRVGGS